MSFNVLFDKQINADDDDGDADKGKTGRRCWTSEGRYSGSAETCRRSHDSTCPTRTAEETHQRISATSAADAETGSAFSHCTQTTDNRTSDQNNGTSETAPRRQMLVLWPYRNISVVQMKCLVKVYFYSIKYVTVENKFTSSDDRNCVFATID